MKRLGWPLLIAALYWLGYHLAALCNCPNLL